MVVAASATCSITINVFTTEGMLLSPSFTWGRAPESSPSSIADKKHSSIIFPYFQMHLVLVVLPKRIMNNFQHR
jgi:hypothetical protein